MIEGNCVWIYPVKKVLHFPFEHPHSCTDRKGRLRRGGDVNFICVGRGGHSGHFMTGRDDVFGRGNERQSQTSSKPLTLSQGAEGPLFREPTQRETPERRDNGRVVRR